MPEYMCHVPVAPIRAEANHRSEQISQLLFGEACEAIEVLGDFTKVTLKYDGYVGWCQSVQLTEITEPANNTFISTDWTSTVFINYEKMKVPSGSSFSFFKDGKMKAGNQYFDFEGRMIDTSAHTFSRFAVKKLALQFLNTPYVWGGRSVFGIDCSGFTQLVYKFFNVPLLRDAYQQFEQGDAVRVIDYAAAGDLAFFDNEAGNITHVGIMLDPRTIIHASGKVRIDDINSKGIINTDTGESTHRLQGIRRMVK